MSSGLTFTSRRPPPVAVNQVWYDGRSSQGIVWAISNLLDPASQPLPLRPGQSFTVTFRDVHVDDYYTGFAFPLAPGRPCMPRWIRSTC